MTDETEEKESDLPAPLFIGRHDEPAIEAPRWMDRRRAVKWIEELFDRERRER